MTGTYHRQVTWKSALAPVTAAAVLFAAVAAVIWFTTPWEPFGDIPVELVTPDADRDFSATEQAAADDYAARIRPPALIGLGIGLAGSLVLGLTPLGARIVTALGSVPARVTSNNRVTSKEWISQLLLGGLALVLIVRVLTLPTAAWAESVRRDQGLSTRDWGEWLLDVGRGFAISAVGALVALLVLVALARWLPRVWWVIAAAAGAGLVVLVSFLYPLIVEPVFNEFTSMDDGELRTSLVDLAEQDGLAVDDVLVADASRRTTTLNAYVSGFGATHRIVVYDTLLDSASDGEIRSVVAHELGHVAEHDVRDGTLLGALAAAAAVCALAALLNWRRLLRVSGSGGPGDPRVIGLVLALAAVASLAATPVENLISRQVEARADVHALDLTRDPETFISLQRSLALRSYRDLDPPALLHAMFASHPSTPERIALARTWDAME